MGADIAFHSEVVKAGRTLGLHLVTASQDGKPVITMTCSFTADTDGYVYDLSGIPDGVALPDDLPAPDDEDHPAPWDVRWIGPSAPRPDGTREATHRHWFRLPRDLDDDPPLHAALLGYATDWTGIGGRPLHLDGDTTGMISLDHAAWFHRPARADEWLLQDVQSLVNAGGRGTLRGVIRDTDGRIVASMAQEMILRRTKPGREQLGVQVEPVDVRVALDEAQPVVEAVGRLAAGTAREVDRTGARRAGVVEGRLVQGGARRPCRGRLRRRPRPRSRPASPWAGGRAPASASR